MKLSFFRFQGLTTGKCPSSQTQLPNHYCSYLPSYVRIIQIPCADTHIKCIHLFIKIQVCERDISSSLIHPEIRV